MRGDSRDNQTQSPAWLRPSRSVQEEEPKEVEAEEEGLPSLSGSEYRAHGRPSNKPLFSLHFVTPAGDVRSFQYHHLDSDSRYSGGAMRIRFVGSLSLGLPAVQVLIEGRNLWALYNYLHQHRMPWILTASRDFVAEKETIVTSVTFTELRPEAE